MSTDAETVVSNSIEEGCYYLPSNKEESERLSLQHEFIKWACNNKIFFLPCEVQPTDKILDIGTGSGIWMFDLAQFVPSTVQFTGIDIDGSMYPNSSPSNITFEIGSVLSLPLNWTSKYDVIHQRFLIAGLQRSQWDAALAEIYRILKPGGWIQLIEIDPTNMAAGAESRRLAEVMNRVFATKDLEVNASLKLPSIIENSGFTNTRALDYPFSLYGSSLDHRKARENMYRGFAHLKGPITQLGGLGVIKGGKDFDRMMLGALNEWENEPNAKQMSIKVVCAQKPVNR